MNEPIIIDAHSHLGTAGQLISPEQTAENMLAYMDCFGIHTTICSDHRAVLGGFDTGIERMKAAFEQSEGRIRCLAVFDPRAAEECTRKIEAVAGWEGLVGIKIHPVCHATAADDVHYKPAWSLANQYDLAVLAHTWSVSDYNPSQILATPDKFERWLKAFPSIRFVLGHAGGRGAGRHEVIRLVTEYPGVHLDFAGDIYCYRLIESLVESVPSDRILFGSDYPWTGANDHLTRILLADIGDDIKADILVHNAAKVYKLKEIAC